MINPDKGGRRGGNNLTWVESCRAANPVRHLKLCASAYEPQTFATFSLSLSREVRAIRYQLWYRTNEDDLIPTLDFGEYHSHRYRYGRHSPPLGGVVDWHTSPRPLPPPRFQGLNPKPKSSLRPRWSCPRTRGSSDTRASVEYLQTSTGYRATGLQEKRRFRRSEEDTRCTLYIVVVG